MKNQNQHMLANESIGRLLWKFSVPSIIGMSVQTFYNIIDTVFIGHAVGMMGIAGLSIVFPIQMIIVGIAQMVALGAASLISISLGENNNERAEVIFGNAISLSIIFGFLIPVIILPFNNYFLYLFGSSPTILPFAKEYMDIILLGTIFTTFNISGVSIIRAEGNAKLPMTIMLLSALINTALDPIFIFWMHMGISGAALATVIAQFIASVYILRYFCGKESTLRLHARNFMLKAKIILKIFSIGFASLIRIGGAGISTIVLNHLLFAYGGDPAIAVYGILNRIISFVFMPIIGIAQGLQPIIGFNFGAKLFVRIKNSVKLAILATTFISLLAFVLMLAFPESFIKIFTTEHIMLERGGDALFFVAFAFPSLGFQVVVATMFQSHHFYLSCNSRFP